MTESNLFYEDLSNGRQLWVDGEETFSKDGLYEKVLSSEDLAGLKIISQDGEIKKFERMTGIKFEIKTKPDYNKIDDTFNIPEKYKVIDLESFFSKKMNRLIKLNNLSNEDIKLRVNRVAQELNLYEMLGLLDVLRTAIYIIDTFKRENVVWGPGRGSSCCSYLLYLIELHDIDSVAFELDVNEFLR